MRTPSQARLRRILGCVAGLALAAAPVRGVEAPCRFDVPAAEAPVTLKQFAAQSGRQILFAPGALAGSKTNAVRGEHTPREALTLMLEGTGLVARVDPETGAVAVRLERAAAPAAASPAAPAPPGRAGRAPEVVQMPAVEVAESRLASEPEQGVDRSVIHLGGARLTVRRFQTLPELKGRSYVLLPLRRSNLGTAQFQEYADLTARELGARGMQQHATADAGATDYLITLDYAVGEPSVGLGATGGPGGGTHPVDDRYPHYVDLKIYNGHVQEKGDWTLKYECRVEGYGYAKDLSIIVPRGLRVILMERPSSSSFPLGPRDE